MGNLKDALKYYEKSLKIQENIGDKNGIAGSLNNIAFIYDTENAVMKNNNVSEKILSYYKRSLALYTEIEDKRGMSNVLKNLSDIYFKQKKYPKALELANKSLEIAKQIGFPESIKVAAKQLSIIFKQQNNFEQALQNYELFIVMRDSINNEETKKASLKNQFQYDYEKREIEIKTLAKAEQEKTALKVAEERKQQSYITYTVFLGLIIVMVFSFFIYRSLLQNRKKNITISKQKQLVEEKQKEILDSILYAKRIQTALLTHEKYIDRNLERLTKVEPENKKSTN
jgi:tetratricopeptide (TPR) repeat protein